MSRASEKRKRAQIDYLHILARENPEEFKEAIGKRVESLLARIRTSAGLLTKRDERPAPKAFELVKKPIAPKPFELAPQAFELAKQGTAEFRSLKDEFILVYGQLEGIKKIDSIAIDLRRAAADGISFAVNGVPAERRLRLLGLQH